MSPSVIEIRRLTIFIAVVLPPPDGPTSTQISPAGIVIESSLTASCGRPGYRFVARSKTISAAVCPLSRPNLAVRRESGKKSSLRDGEGAQVVERRAQQVVAQVEQAGPDRGAGRQRLQADGGGQAL